jgi:hypothetical protein
MAFKDHPRHITDEQFSQETTIDGSRIDSAMEDIVSHVNNIPKGDIETRYVQTQFVAGWAPNKFGAAELHKMPWLDSINKDGDMAGEPPLRYQNPLRLKSCDAPGMNRAQVSPLTDDSGIWMTPINFGSPVIVQEIHVICCNDTVAVPRSTGFDEDFLYAASAPPNFSVGNRSEDLAIVMDIDHPFAPEDRAQNSIELSRNRFQFSGSSFTAISWPAESAEGSSWNDMRPKAFPGGGPGGFSVVMDDLNIPLAAGSRARLSIQIPTGGRAFTNPWGARPASATYWSVTLTCLEEIV